MMVSEGRAKRIKALTNGNPASTNTGRFQYTGQLWLEGAGVYHYKNRAYHPGMMRFLQADPIGVAGGINLYAYVGGDPVNFVDPMGLSRLDQFDECVSTGRTNRDGHQIISCWNRRQWAGSGNLFGPIDTPGGSGNINGFGDGGGPDLSMVDRTGESNLDHCPILTFSFGSSVGAGSRHDSLQGAAASGGVRVGYPHRSMPGANSDLSAILISRGLRGDYILGTKVPIGTNSNDMSFNGSSLGGMPRSQPMCLACEPVAVVVSAHGFNRNDATLRGHYMTGPWVYLSYSRIAELYGVDLVFAGNRNGTQARFSADGNQGCPS